MFQRQQQLRPICQKQLYIDAGEYDCNFRILYFWVRIFRRAKLEGDLKASLLEDRRKELLQPRPQRIDLIFHAAYFFTVLFTGAFGGGAGGAAGVGINLLIMSCWAIPTRLLVNQYSTSPADAK